MPIRHLSLGEPQYVPSYNTLDLSLVSGVDQEINRQGIVNRQQSSGLFQNVQENIINNLGNLSDEHKLSAAELVDESRSNIDRIFEERGARHAMPGIEREAGKLTQSLKPYQQRSAELRSFAETIEESEAPSHWKNYYYNYLSDQGSRSIDESIQMDNYFEALKNYKDPREFAKEMKGLMGRKGASTLNPDGTFASPEANVWIERSGRSALELNDILVAEALNDPQMRMQFEFEAKMLAESGDPLFSQYFEENDNGERVFNPTKTEFFKVVDNQQTEEKVSLNAIQQLAIRQFAPTAAIMADDSATIKKNAFLGDNDNNLPFGNRRLSTITATSHEDVESWAGRLTNELKANNEHLEMSKRNTQTMFKESGYDLSISMDQSTRDFIYTIDGQNYSYSEVRDLVRGDSHLSGYLEAVHLEKEGIKDLIDANESTIERYTDRVKDSIERDPELAPFVDAIKFDMESGEIIIDRNVIAQELEKYNHTIKEKPILIPRGEVERLGLNSLNPGEFRDIEYYATSTFSSGQATGVSRKTKHNVTITRTPEGRFVEDKSNFNKRIRDVISVENERFMREDIYPHFEAPAVHFDPTKDKDIITEFANFPTSELAGLFTDYSGNLISGLDEKEAYTVHPWKLGLDYEGNPVIQIEVKDSNKQLVEEGFIGGHYVNSIAQDMMGSDYQLLLMQRQFQKIFPQITNEREEFKLSDGSKGMFQLNHLKDKDVSIITTTSRRQGIPSKNYIVRVDGIPQQFQSFEQILPYLLEYPI